MMGELFEKAFIDDYKQQLYRVIIESPMYDWYLSKLKFSIGTEKSPTGTFRVFTFEDSNGCSIDFYIGPGDVSIKPPYKNNKQLCDIVLRTIGKEYGTITCTRTNTNAGKIEATAYLLNGCVYVHIEYYLGFGEYSVGGFFMPLNSWESTSTVAVTILNRVIAICGNPEYNKNEFEKIFNAESLYIAECVEWWR